MRRSTSRRPVRPQRLDGRTAAPGKAGVRLFRVLADPLKADVPGDPGLDGEGRWTYDRHTMCRNIRVLYNFEPPTTEDEIRAAAVQYVRKVSGLAKPPAIDVVTFERAVGEVAATTRRLLGSLHARTSVRTR